MSGALHVSHPCCSICHRTLSFYYLGESIPHASIVCLSQHLIVLLTFFVPFPFQPFCPAKSPNIQSKLHETKSQMLALWCQLWAVISLFMIWRWLYWCWSLVILDVCINHAFLCPSLYLCFFKYCSSWVFRLPLFVLMEGIRKLLAQERRRRRGSNIHKEHAPCRSLVSFFEARKHIQWVKEKIAVKYNIDHQLYQPWCSVLFPVICLLISHLQYRFIFCRYRKTCVF